MPRRPAARLALACALLAAWGLGLRFAAVSSPTFDEPVHLASGFAALREGGYGLNALDHPPLAEMWAAVPLLALRPRTFADSPERRERRAYRYADLFLYRNSVRPGLMIGAARAFALLTWSALLLGTLAAWARRLGGETAAAGALAAAVLSPALVSNLALVTTDGAAAALGFAALWLLGGEEAPPSARLAAAGAAAGLATAAKFNMAPLVPLGLVLLALDRRLSPGPRRPFPRAGAALFAAAAALALAAVYRFVHLPLYFQGLAATSRRMGEARAFFLLGRVGTGGTWLYFPAALLLKTPLAILLLAGLGAAAAARRLARREALWLFAPPAAYFAAALVSPLDIGVRHLLPVLPFVALLAGLGAASLLDKPRGTAAAALLGAWAAVSVGLCAPRLLAYFNELCGGPAGGIRALADSNLDWGQDLRGLARWLAKEGDPPIYLSYFGTADPAAYGVRYAPVLMMPHVERPGNVADPAASGRVLLAVSATNLQGVYFSDRGVFDWLRRRRPLEVFGHTIFLYDLTRDPDGRARLARIVPRGQGAPEALR